MTPVDQTKFGPEEGNCLTACVASLLDLAIEDVPFTGADAAWREQFDAFCLSLGLQLRGRGPRRPYAGYAIACGQSPRFENAGHAVVVLDGVLAHDPHPDRTGITEVWEYFAIAPIQSESTFFHRQMDLLNDQANLVEEP